MVTIRDVAKESGFSSTTVSIVLNNAPLARYIPTTTKKRIESAAKKLGYRPNLFARSLRSRRSHTIGVMVFDMTDPFCTLVLRGIENSLYQASYLPILTDVQNERARFERYLEMLLDRRVEALIVAGQLAVCEYRCARRSRKKQHPDRDDRAGVEERRDQLGDRRQRTGGLHRRGTFVLAWPSQDCVHSRTKDFERQRCRAGKAFARLRKPATWNWTRGSLWIFPNRAIRCRVLRRATS